VKNGTPLNSIQYGGGTSASDGPGTENVPGAVALGRAAAVALENLGAESARIASLRDRLEQGITAGIPSCGVNGQGRHARPTQPTYFLMDWKAKRW